MKVVIKHHQAVWETTTIEVEVPNLDYAIEHANELIDKGLYDDTADVVCGDTVESVSSDIEIMDENGKMLHQEADLGDIKLVEDLRP